MAAAMVVQYARPTQIVPRDLVRFALVVCLIATIHMTVSWSLMRNTTEREWLSTPINCIAWMPGTAVIEMADNFGRGTLFGQSLGVALMVAGSTLTACGTVISFNRISQHNHPGLLPLFSAICWLGWLPVPQPLSFMYHFQLWVTTVH